MSSKASWSRILVVVGGLLTVVGVLDPLEGSLVILAGCGMVLLGTYLAGQPRPVLNYWIWVFALVAGGVAFLWGFSALGGVGGSTGRSMWWLLTMVTYPVGWLMAFGGIIVRIFRFVKTRGERRNLAGG